jgi:hypothetical protein
MLVTRLLSMLLCEVSGDGCTEHRSTALRLVLRDAVRFLTSEQSQSSGYPDIPRRVRLRTAVPCFDFAC